MENGLNLLKFRLLEYPITDSFYDSRFLPIVTCQLPGTDENPKGCFRMSDLNRGV